MSTRLQISTKPTIAYNPHIEGRDLTEMVIQPQISGESMDFTYRVRDYGRLPLWIAQLLEEYHTIPDEWKTVREKYGLDDFFIAYVPPRNGYIKWTLTRELPRIDILEKRTEKRRGKGKKKMIFSLGPIGQEIFKAVQKSQNWLISFENLTLLRLLAHKLKSLGDTLNAIHKYGSVECTSTNWPSFKFSWEELSSNLWDVFLVHTEKLDIMPECRSPNIPPVLSGLIYNESYLAHFAIRKTIIEKFVKGTKNRGVSVNIAELSKRVPHEVSRGLEKIGVLHAKRGLEHVSIPDRMLLDLVMFALYDRKARTIHLKEFIDVLKNMFRVLVDPHDIKIFLKNSVECESLGIDLTVAIEFFRSNYEVFIERMVSLGLARVRPDGEVSIEIT